MCRNGRTPRRAPDAPPAGAVPRAPDVPPAGAVPRAPDAPASGRRPPRPPPRPRARPTSLPPYGAEDACAYRLSAPKSSMETRAKAAMSGTNRYVDVSVARCAYGGPRTLRVIAPSAT